MDIASVVICHKNIIRGGAQLIGLIQYMTETTDCKFALEKVME